MNIFKILKGLFLIGLGLILEILGILGLSTINYTDFPLRPLFMVIICLPLGLYLCFKGMESIIYINKKPKNDVSGD
jgi:uncharacterized membrane protein